MSQFKYRISVAPLKDGVRGRAIGSVGSDSVVLNLIYALGFPTKEMAEQAIIDQEYRERNPDLDFKVVPW